MAEVGDISEVPGETLFEWKIRDFFSLSDKKDTHYESPKFYFGGASWLIQIYPNGESKKDSEGWISLLLSRRSSGSTITLNFSFLLRSVDGKTDLERYFSTSFEEEFIRAGYFCFIKREELIENKSQLVPANDLTIICTLKNTEKNSLANSLFRRQQDICDNLRDIYIEAKRTDFKMKFTQEDRALRAHRIILETRSPVFAAWFKHDTTENERGEAAIDDIDRSTMDTLLQYIYCGDISSPSSENAITLYAAAEKYDIDDVKVICLKSIIRSLSVDSVCDVIKFAELYQEEEVNRHAREFFKENAEEILENENWKTFAKENNALGFDLLGSLVKTLLPKTTNKK